MEACKYYAKIEDLIMAAPKRTARKARTKSTKQSPAKVKIDLQAMLSDKLGNQPVGKALAAIDLLYQELDDMEMRLEILVSRIEILKKRTEALREGESISLTSVLGTLIGDSPNALRSAMQKVSTSEHRTEDEKVEWTKLKLLEETTINDVLLASETIVSIESRAAAGLIKKGVAEQIEASDTEENEKEEPGQTAE